MLTYQIESEDGCQEHGIDCPYLIRNQPPNFVVGHKRSISEMYELREHNCAMIRLYAYIGLLRRSRWPENFPSDDHPCLDSQFYQDFKQMLVKNRTFYLSSSSRTLISILSSIADHDPTDSAIATVALLLSRTEEIVNTCIGFNPWQADPEQYKDACRPPYKKFLTLGFSHETCGTLYALAERLANTIKQADLVHQITSELYDRLLDPTSGYPYSPSVVRSERQHPNWIQMISEQTDTKDFAKNIYKMICY